MALNFPDTPVDGEQSTQPNGVTYEWQAAKTRWISVTTLTGVSGVSIIQDEGVDVTTAATLLNFVGDGVEATEPGVAGEITVTIPGGGGGGAEKPVGAVELGYDPNGILPGTWTQWAEGTFVMNTINGADPSGGDNDAVVVDHLHAIAHTHDITHSHTASSGNDTPDHTHTLPRATSTSNSANLGMNSGDGIVDYGNTSAGANTRHTHPVTVNSHGGVTGPASANSASAGVSGTNKNKPKYKGVAVWERTA